jgi:hypothetical protein
MVQLNFGFNKHAGLCGTHPSKRQKIAKKRANTRTSKPCLFNNGFIDEKIFALASLSSPGSESGRSVHAETL